MREEREMENLPEKKEHIGREESYFPSWQRSESGRDWRIFERLGCFLLQGINRRKGKHRKALKQLDRSDAGQKGAGGGDKGGADDGCWVDRSRRSEDADCGGRDELDRARVDGKEGAHRVGGSAGTGIERFKILHGTQSERSGGIAETEHVGGDVHHHRSHGGMIGGYLGEETNEQGA